MAELIRNASSNLTPIQHSTDIFKNYLKQMSLAGMMGKKGSGKPIIVDDTLSGKAGDTIRYHFIPQDASDGILGQDASILGNEKSLSEYYFDLSIDILTQAYRKKGKMTDQRLVWNFRNEAKMQLTNWWAQKSEDLMFKALTGIISGMTETYTATTDLVIGDHRCIRADGANGYVTVVATGSDDTALAGAMNSSDKMSVNLIERAAIEARTAGTYKMRPMRVGKNGEEFFVLFIDLHAAHDLRFSPDWQNHAYSVIERGIGDDPIATGALGVWNNVIVKPSERVVRFTVDSGTNNYARNLLIGADAAILGWAQRLEYSEEMVDHNTTLSIAASEIRGQTKVKFNITDSTQEDAGVFQVISAAN
jgi:N4-gp56 family major capsid protein